MNHKEAMKLIKESNLLGPAHSDLDVVREILEGRDDLVEAMNAVDYRKVDEIPQHAAAHCKRGPILEYLLEKGVRLDAFMAAALGRVDELKEMLAADPSLAKAKGAHDIPILKHALNDETAEVITKAGNG